VLLYTVEDMHLFDYDHFPPACLYNTIMLLSVLLQLLLLATTPDKVPLLLCLRIVSHVELTIQST